MDEQKVPVRSPSVRRRAADAPSRPAGPALLAGVVAGWTALSAVLVTVASTSGLLVVGLVVAAVGAAALTDAVIFLAGQHQRRALVAAAVGAAFAVVVCALLL